MAVKPPKSSSSSRLVSRSELARRLGVSRPAVTQACRPGGRLHEACDGTTVDVEHAAVKRWLAQRDAATKDYDPPTPGQPIEAEVDEPIFADPQELLAALTDERPQPLTDLKDPVMVERWVRTHKLTEEAIKAKRLRERVERSLIPKTTVERAIAHVDTGFRLLLSDAPRAIATRLAAHDMTAATAMIRDVLSQHLTAARDRMAASVEADDPTAVLCEAAE